MLTVWKLDRLGRNTQHVLAVVDQLTSRGIGFRSLTEGLHTEGPMGTAMLTIMAAFAQLERDTMIERTRAGLAAAAANGMKCGRPRKFDDADAAKARQLRAKGIAATDIAKMLSVSRATGRRTPDDGWAAWLGLGIVTVGTKGVLAPVLRRQLSGMSWSPLES